jgi:hypothetical protein
LSQKKIQNQTTQKNQKNESQNKILYVKGDATAPIGEGNKILIHCCNDKGRWGRGFVLALTRRWKAPEREYRNWYSSKKGFKLGKVQYVKVEEDLVVCNMIGQHDTRTISGVPPIRYGAIRKCLDKVAEAAIINKASVHAPKFGSALAGGSWDKIEELINECLIEKGVNVTVYSL